VPARAWTWLSGGRHGADGAGGAAAYGARATSSMPHPALESSASPAITRQTPARHTPAGALRITDGLAQEAAIGGRRARAMGKREMQGAW
jgi:hypothetical protein